MVSDDTKIVLVLEYDGTGYNGFQLQNDEPTIQGELETAVLKLTGKISRVISASRTDSGVHARGQVASFRTDSVLAPERFVAGLNFYLPKDIAVKAAFRVGDSFDVRRDALSREYKYYIWNSLTRSPLRRNYSYQVKNDLNIENMNRACGALCGRHNLISFATDLEDDEKSSTVRDVYRAEVVREGRMMVFNVKANAFLRHQVRNTVGALIMVGSGKISIDEFNGIIDAEQQGRAGPAVPAYGLFLERVNYPEPFQEMFNENV